MSENGGTWPPGSRGPADPRRYRDPRSPAAPGRPEPSAPPGHETVHPRDTDPRYGQDPWTQDRRYGQDPRRQDPRYGQDPPPGQDPRYGQDSPWSRTQRSSRPEAAGWQPGVPAGYQPPGDESYPARRREDPDVYDQYQDEDPYGGGHRFVPGFGDRDDPDDRGDRDDRYDRDDHDDWEYADEPGRRPARSRQRPRGRPPKPPRRRRFRWLAPLFALAVILIPVAIGGYVVFHLYMERYHPADYSGPGTGEVVVQVASGDTATSLGPKLAELGVVASARAFVLAAEHSSNTGGLVPGFYKLHEHMKASLAYALLLSPSNLVQITVTIPEGWRLSQIVGWLGKKSGLPSSAYDDVLKDPAQLHLPAFAKGHPEGYLFPATYEVLPHETALGVLTAMVQRFDQEAVTLNLPAAARQVHLSEAQVIIMASLVQAEGGRVSDYPKIARVIYNRLSQNIPLELDSTVLYGLGKYGIIASDQDLNSTSPYNTYKYKGLTPGPIDSPGAAAIEAVLHPASGNWLYFVTVNPKTGLTLFTASEAQFEQYRTELEHNLGQG